MNRRVPAPDDTTHGGAGFRHGRPARRRWRCRARLRQHCRLLLFSGHGMRASGTFEVKLTPQPAAPGTEAAKLGRLAVDKRFQGDLEGSSLGEMLSAGTE